MAIRENSYGDTSEIAALIPRYDNGSGVFDTNTTPTLLQVESLVDQVSGALNSVLAENGFEIPVSQADVKLVLDGFVNDEVAQIAVGINGSGRFGPSKAGYTASRHKLISDDVTSFVAANATGFERLGATRENNNFEIGSRTADESGDEVTPIFQRKGFGNEFTEWDD